MTKHNDRACPCCGKDNWRMFREDEDEGGELVGLLEHEDPSWGPLPLVSIELVDLFLHECALMDIDECQSRGAVVSL